MKLKQYAELLTQMAKETPDAEVVGQNLDEQLLMPELGKLVAGSGRMGHVQLCFFSLKRGGAPNGIDAIRIG